MFRSTGPLLLVLAGGCASGPMLDSSSSAVVVSGALPAPDNRAATVDLAGYRLGPRDVIRVDVFGAPELTREAEVDASGRFSMPLIGEVAAAGSSPTELSTRIAERLRGSYLKDPQVSVNLVKAQSQTFTVDGAVREPGVYPLVGRTTLQEAVATARGTDQVANLDNVVVFRTVNDRKMAALFSLKQIRAGQLRDPEIYGNDIIVVGESAARRFFRDFGSAFPILGTFVPFF